MGRKSESNKKYRNKKLNIIDYYPLSSCALTSKENNKEVCKESSISKQIIELRSDVIDVLESTKKIPFNVTNKIYNRMTLMLDKTVKDGNCDSNNNCDTINNSTPKTTGTEIPAYF